MPNDRYDAVVIGSGHNGLCAAAYLARAGLKVGVFESRHEEAGAVQTSEATMPGFWHNLHAQYMEFIDYMPFYHDFDLASFGVRLIKPDCQVGMAFADGRPPLLIYRPGLEEKTYRSIAVHSEEDAKRFAEIRRKVMARSDLLASLIYTPKEPMVAAIDMLELWADLGLTGEDMQRTPKEIIDNLFESTELRAVLYRQCLEWGADPHTGPGTAFIVCCIWLCANHYMVTGGTHMLGHAMAGACLSQGVDIRYNQKVVGISTEAERATGIVLQDGREVKSEVIVSNLDVRTTFVDLLGQEALTPGMRDLVDNWRFGPEHCLGVASYALRTPPSYKSAKHDPDIDRCFYTIVGYETAEDVSENILQAFAGKPPDTPACGTWVNTLWDPSQAPPGAHAMNGWYFLPKASDLTSTEWEDLRGSYNERFLGLWETYAPNMTRQNVIAEAIQTPLDTEQEMGMPEGDFGHGRPRELAALARGETFPPSRKADIEGLYTCSGNGVSAAPGYSVVKLIAEDRGLPAVWNREGRIY